MNVGNLTWGHLGKTVTIRGEEDSSITGKLTSMDYSWGELFMGKMVMREAANNDSLRLTIGGWPVVIPMDTDIEVEA